MIIEKTYSEFDLEKGRCKSCNDRTAILKEDIDNRYTGMCPDCIEAIEFEKMSGF